MMTQSDASHVQTIYSKKESFMKGKLKIVGACAIAVLSTFSKPS
jgi:hypothetical protein